MGIFSWTVDDDNGMLLEAIHSVLSKKVSTVNKSVKPHIYAPDCSSFSKITIKPGMVFKKGDAIYRAKGWATKCPGEGAQWEQNSWEEIGKTSSFCVVGEANDCKVEYKKD